MKETTNTQPKPAREAAIRAYILRLLARTAGITMVLAFAVAARATPLPWQHNSENVYPWEGFLTIDHPTIDNALVAQPKSPGKLFESINWYQPQGNLNAGAAIEQGPYWGGLIWWDFLGGHQVFSDTTWAWETNGPLHLGLSYAEVTSGPGVETWWKIPYVDRFSGLAQIEPDPHIGGWVTHINLYTKPVPDTGSSISFLGLGFLFLALARIKLYEP